MDFRWNQQSGSTPRWTAAGAVFGRPAISSILGPLIPCTLLAAIFFVLAFHYESEDAARLRKLPGEPARPPRCDTMRPVVLQLTQQDTVIVAGDEAALLGAKSLLERERAVLGRPKATGDSAPMLIIRADPKAAAGKVQQVILSAQQAGFERFQLRAADGSAAAPHEAAHGGG